MSGMERGCEVAVAQEGWSLGQEPKDCCWRSQSEQGMDGEAGEGRWEVLSKEPTLAAGTLVSTLGPAKWGEHEGATLREGARRQEQVREDKEGRVICS